MTAGAMIALLLARGGRDAAVYVGRERVAVVMEGMTVAMPFDDGLVRISGPDESAPIVYVDASSITHVVLSVHRDF